MATTVYRYGLAAPHEEHDRILDQMRAAQRYRNVLVEIERARRVAERTLLAEAAPEMATLIAQAQDAERALEEAIDAIRRTRGKTRKRSETAEQKLSLQNARIRCKTAATALREARKKLRDSPEVVAARDVLSERAGEFQRGARALSGLARSGPHYGAWGTYQLVEEAAQASFADTPLYGPDGVSPLDPAFLRWTGDGAVSVQIQGGATLEEATGGEHAQLRITLPDERAWLKMPDNGWSARRRYAREGQLALCLGTDAEGTRIYGQWRLDMHRPLPKDARIKRATVSRRMCGPHPKWSLELTVESAPRAVAPPTTGGSIAIDLGWRLMPDGSLRVCGWADETGATGDLRLSREEIRALRDPDEIRSRRDSLFDLEILRLRRWLVVQDVKTLPACLQEASYGKLAQWKSAARLASLRNRWAEARVPGDEIPFASLDAWATADRHYWEQESRRRDAALRRRREGYRVFAANLVRRYDTIVLEQFDLRKIARRSAVDAEKPENETARSHRQLAGVSILRLSIIQAAQGAGRAVLAMPAKDTTRTCPVCGLVEKRDAAASIVLVCECGAEWDQDTHGAAPLLLTSARERPGDAKILVRARGAEDTEEVKESRRDRVKRLRAAKVARMAARKADGNAAE